MLPQHYNLIDQPWIKVVTNQGKIDTVSLINLFKHAQDYQQLAGDMRVQNLSILRLLEAILITVYSRYNAQGQPYGWLDVNPKNMTLIIDDEDDLNEDYHDNQSALLKTWSDLYQQSHFSPVVIKYLELNKNKFDFFDQSKPFYQVSQEVYNQNVSPRKQIKKDDSPGQVPIKQLNRTINESGNTQTIFSLQSELHKNDVTTDELIRWIITYQNFTGTGDKSKIQNTISKSQKPSSSMGYLYSIHPVYARGSNLFETLMLNLTLTTDHHTSLIEKPVWEQDPQDYISKYGNTSIIPYMPDNLAELYTLWSRAIVIREEDSYPVVYAAKLLRPDSTNYFLEPMTTWRQDKDQIVSNKIVSNDFIRSMWANFGEYINDTVQMPGIIDWFKALQRKKIISHDKQLHLVTNGFIHDGTPASKLPELEVFYEMSIPATVLHDQNTLARWSTRIADAVNNTNYAINLYRKIVQTAGIYKGLHQGQALKAFSDQYIKQIYLDLNNPFNNWLMSLTDHDDRDQKVQEWYHTVRKLLYRSSQQALAIPAATTISHPIVLKDEFGEKSSFAKQPHNFFEIDNYYYHIILKHLPAQKERSEKQS